MLVVVVAELTVRGLGLALDRSFAIEPYRLTDDSLYVSHPFVGYTPRAGHRNAKGDGFEHSVNGLGFRGPEISREKPEDVYRIVCLGGSTTWGIGANGDALTWPAIAEWLLQGELPRGGTIRKVEVVNAGVPGYTSLESFVNLKTRVLPLDPDAIIVYHAANDARVMLRPGFVPDHTHARRSWTNPAPPWLLDGVLGWSHLYGLVTRGTAPRKRPTIHDWLAVPGYEDGDFVDPDAQTLSPALDAYASTLREIVAIARAHDCCVALSTFAWSPDDDVPDDQRAWREAYATTMDEINGTTRRTAEQLGCTLIDVKAAGPSAVDDFSDFIHLSEDGRRRMGKLVAETVVAAGWLEGRCR